jgi:hypothetical protein
MRATRRFTIKSRRQPIRWLLLLHHGLRDAELDRARRRRRRRSERYWRRRYLREGRTLPDRPRG